MNPQDIIRAWRDKAFRDSLSDADRAQLPENPAGLVELQDVELSFVAGGTCLPDCTQNIDDCSTFDTCAIETLGTCCVMPPGGGGPPGPGGTDWSAGGGPCYTGADTSCGSSCGF